MNAFRSTILAMALTVPCGLAMQQTKTNQAPPQPTSTLRELILKSDLTESLRLARQNPSEVTTALNDILEQVDGQITDRKIAEARSALTATDKFMDAYAAADSGKDGLKDSIKGRILRVEGIQLGDDKQYAKAEETLEKALELSRKSGDKRLEAGVHNNLAYALAGQDKADDAIVEYEVARRMAEQQQDLLRAGAYNFNLGFTLYRMGRNEAALGAFKRSAEQSRSVSKASMEARALLYEGITTGKITPTSKDAISYFAQAEKIYEQLADDRNTGFSLWMMAQQTAFAGDMMQARPEAERAIPFLIKAGDKETLYNCYQFLAMTYDLTKSDEDKAKAEKYRKLADGIKKENPG